MLGAKKMSASTRAQHEVHAANDAPDQYTLVSLAICTPFPGAGRSVDEQDFAHQQCSHVQILQASSLTSYGWSTHCTPRYSLRFWKCHLNLMYQTEGTSTCVREHPEPCSWSTLCPHRAMANFIRQCTEYTYGNYIIDACDGAEQCCGNVLLNAPSDATNNS